MRQGPGSMSDATQPGPRAERLHIVRHVDEDPGLDEISKVFVTGTKRGDRFAIEKSVFIRVLIHSFAWGRA